MFLFSTPEKTQNETGTTSDFSTPRKIRQQKRHQLKPLVTLCIHFDCQQYTVDAEIFVGEIFRELNFQEIQFS